MKKKIAIAVTALALVAIFVVGGSLAWLVDAPDSVTNTFTCGDINITLKETTTDYKMVPGNKIAKDPQITVEAGSEECWLFVKIEQSSNYSDYLKQYKLATAWKLLEGQTDVYYYNGSYEVGEPVYILAGEEESTLKNGFVEVQPSVTKTMMENIKNGTTTAPTLTFTAYAVQKANIDTAKKAWEAITNPTDSQTPTT